MMRFVPVLILTFFIPVFFLPCRGFCSDDAVMALIDEELNVENSATSLMNPGKDIFFEAEDLVVDGEGWRMKTHTGSWHPGGAASGFRFLDGNNAIPALATYSLPVIQDGDYTLWVRYLDLSVRRKNSGFTVRIRQGDTTLAEKIFDEGVTGIRTGLESAEKWGGGNAQPVWAPCAVHIPQKGPLTVEVRKLHENQPSDEWGRLIDCFILTSNRNFAPGPDTTTSLYLRVTMGKKQPAKVPLVIEGASSPLITGTDHLYAGLDAWKPEIGISPGSKTSWLNIGKYLPPGRVSRLCFKALPEKPDPYHPEPAEGTSEFTVVFSRTPSEAGIIKEFSRSGRGYGITCLVSPAAGDKEKIKSEIDYTRRSLRFAEQTPDYPNGKRPLRFPFGATMAVNPMFASPYSVTGEMDAQASIGLNNLGNPALDMTDEAIAKGFTHCRTGCILWMLTDGCLCSPNTEAMKAAVTKEFGKLRPTVIEHAESAGVMDEPQFGVSHVMECKSTTRTCAQRYVDFLRQQQVDPADLGLNELAQAKLSRDPATGANFYWTVRYRNQVVTRMLAACSDAIHRVRKNLPADANIATEIVTNGNMVQFGLDWFDLFSTGSLGFGLTEDWSNGQKTYQLGSYMMDVMRAATKYRNQPFGMHNILCWRSEWEIAAKGFAEIGHGARMMEFFRYGPGWTGKSDSMSHQPEIYSAIKMVTFCTGAVEDSLLDGKTTVGDAAILLSVTGDIWNILSFDNPFGKERMYLSLLLLHCGIRTDILAENDLRTELKKYKMLFVTDSSIQKDCVPDLVRWVKAGGTLYLSAGALIQDEYGRLLDFDKQVGIRRDRLVLPRKDAPFPPEENTIDYGQGKIRMGNGYQVVSNGSIFCVDKAGRGMVSSFGLGSGHIIFCGVFPATAYFTTDSAQVENSAYSHRKYPDTHRDLMKKILGLGGVVPKISTDQPLVEVTLTESPQADIITLSNWSFTEVVTEITLHTPNRYKEIRSIAGQIEDVSYKQGRIVMKLKVGAGDHIECRK